MGLRHRRIKGNVGEDESGIKFDIQRHPDPKNAHGVLVWLGATEVQTPIVKVPMKYKEALEWLRSRLSSGPVEVPIILKEGADRGFSSRTLERAKSEIAKSIRIGKGHWSWELLPPPGAVNGAVTVTQQVPA